MKANVVCRTLGILTLTLDADDSGSGGNYRPHLGCVQVGERGWGRECQPRGRELQLHWQGVAIHRDLQPMVSVLCPGVHGRDDGESVHAFHRGGHRWDRDLQRRHLQPCRGRRRQRQPGRALVGESAHPSGFTGGVLTAPFTFAGEFHYNDTPTTGGILDLLGGGTAQAELHPVRTHFRGRST